MFSMSWWLWQSELTFILYFFYSIFNISNYCLVYNPQWLLWQRSNWSVCRWRYTPLSGFTSPQSTRRRRRRRRWRNEATVSPSPHLGKLCQNDHEIWKKGNTNKSPYKCLLNSSVVGVVHGCPCGQEDAVCAGGALSLPGTNEPANC